MEEDLESQYQPVPTDSNNQVNSVTHHAKKATKVKDLSAGILIPTNHTVEELGFHLSAIMMKMRMQLFVTAIVMLISMETDLFVGGNVQLRVMYMNVEHFV
jgi:hypothetical protein